jgi:prepilin-type N-terminal cleavage/methylation domain-containing protein
MLYRNHDSRTSERGFSLIELLIAMTVTLVVAGLASTLLAASLKMRTRENARTDSIADVQRALNIMAREIAIGGYGFDANSNGLVVGDSDAVSIRVRSNLNRYSDNSTTTTELSEDLKYFVDIEDGQNFLVRYDKNAPAGTQATVLANRLDTLSITYWSVTNSQLGVAADPAQVANAVALTITVSTLLPAVGVQGSPGYQPATTIQLSSDVALRNKRENLTSY